MTPPPTSLRNCFAGMAWGAEAFEVLVAVVGRLAVTVVHFARSNHHSALLAPLAQRVARELRRANAVAPGAGVVDPWLAVAVLLGIACPAMRVAVAARYQDATTDLTTRAARGKRHSTPGNEKARGYEPIGLGILEGERRASCQWG